MGEAVYAINDFPDDDRLWRIEWIGGVVYNASVPSDPQIDVCLARLPEGETNPLSARACSAQKKRTVKIGVGLLPYISIASVWRQRRPLTTKLAANRYRLCIDTSSCQMVPLADLANAIPRSSYLFGVSWPDVRGTLLVTVEQDGDPYAVMIPTAEIIRFYYAPSTRLAQALFWGEYAAAFNIERSGVLENGAVRIHLRRWLEDQDAWTLARYLCSPAMQRETRRLFRGLQISYLNATNFKADSHPALRCGFPFEGATTIQGVALRLPGKAQGAAPRWLMLQIERCSAPFPFDRVIVERDNNSAPGENADDENLLPAWAKSEDGPAGVVERPKVDTFQANEEPRRGIEPMRIDLVEDRFEYLSGRELIKEQKTVQYYRFSPIAASASQMLTGLGTGQGTWGASNLQMSKLTTVQSRTRKARETSGLPATMETFVQAIELLAGKRPCEVGLIGLGEGDTSFGAHTVAAFPTHHPRNGKRIRWAWIKKESRARHVGIARIRLGDKVAYALEIERTNQKHSVLILARNDFHEIGSAELRRFLLMSALRRGWASEDQTPEYRRGTTTHRELVDVSVLESRVWRKIEEVFRRGETC
jgi:hypothetical protein